MCLTSPVKWFPEKKGLITGIAAAGFGLGAVFMSEIVEILLENGSDILKILRTMSISYGLLIFIFSALIFQKKEPEQTQAAPVNKTEVFRSAIFGKLFAGIFMGTFAGLLIIGSLRIIGGQFDIAVRILVHGIAVFAVANFLGRLTWGILSDHIGASLSIFLALLFQSIAILALNLVELTAVSYLIISFLIGFGFGGNFVLFAKETAQVFGVRNLGIIYPYVFLGYAIAGILGPMSGGYLYDASGSYSSAIYLASLISLIGGLIFLLQYFSEKKCSDLK